MVGHARASQAALGRGVAVDTALGRFVPANVEGAQLGKEVQAGVGQVVVNPPGHGCPGAAFLHVVHQPGHDDAGHGAVLAVGIGLIPDVARAVLLVAGAVEVVAVAQVVDLGRAVGGADVDAPEGGLQRLQQLLAQHAAVAHRQIRVDGHIAQAMPDGNLAVQKVAHEKIAREANAAEVFELGVGGDGGHAVLHWGESWHCVIGSTQECHAAIVWRLGAWRQRRKLADGLGRFRSGASVGLRCALKSEP